MVGSQLVEPFRKNGQRNFVFVGSHRLPIGNAVDTKSKSGKENGNQGKVSGVSTVCLFVCITW
jgi:hypothetical protein